MKTFLKMLIAFAAFGLPITALAQNNAFIQIQGQGGTQTAPLDPKGDASFESVKPGNYAVALLVPAVQKVREAAASSSPTASNDKHKGEIEILSWSWGASNPGTMGAGGGGGAGKVKFNEFQIKKTTDKATPMLAKSVGGSRSTLDRKTTHNGQEYYIVKLSDILVSSVQAPGGGGGGGSEAPTESLSLNFTKIEFKYSPTR